MTDSPAWPLSVVIICCDERDTLPRAIASARPAREIVVLDSGSRDGTREWLREQTGLSVHDRPFDDFASQKNAAVALAREPWVFVLDADEWIEPDLGAALSRFNPESKEAAFSVLRINRFMGREIRHAFGRDAIPRLFHRDRARYATTRVHERLEVLGPIGQIAGRLGHDPYQHRGLAAHLAKSDRYTTLGALDRWQAAGRIGAFQLVLKPLLAFLKRYLLRGGFRDGLPGLFLSASGAWNVFLRSVKIARLQAGDDLGDPLARAALREAAEVSRGANQAR